MLRYSRVPVNPCSLGSNILHRVKVGVKEEREVQGGEKRTCAILSWADF